MAPGLRSSQVVDSHGVAFAFTLTSVAWPIHIQKSRRPLSLLFSSFGQHNHAFSVLFRYWQPCRYGTPLRCIISPCRQRSSQAVKLSQEQHHNNRIIIIINNNDNIFIVLLYLGHTLTHQNLQKGYKHHEISYRLIEKSTCIMSSMALLDLAQARRGRELSPLA